MVKPSHSALFIAGFMKTYLVFPEFSTSCRGQSGKRKVTEETGPLTSPLMGANVVVKWLSCKDPISLNSS